MESEGQAVVKKIPWLGIIAIAYGLCVLGLVPVIAKIYHMSGTDSSILRDSIIAVLSLLLLSHFSLYKILKKPQHYKLKIIIWIGVVFSYFVLCNCIVEVVFKPKKYEQQLKSVLINVDHIKVRSASIVVKNFNTSEEEFIKDWLLFEETDISEIQLVIGSIKIIPFGYPGHCACAGNQKIEFYQGDRLCAELTFHHGKSLRWLKSWPSDMSLTNNSAAYLKSWMSENSVDNFD